MGAGTVFTTLAEIKEFSVCVLEWKLINGKTWSGKCYSKNNKKMSQ